MGGNPFTTFPAAVGAVGGWKELGRTTLGVAGNDITVSSLPDKRYYMILGYTTANSASPAQAIQLGNSTIDTGTNYSYRRSLNAASDTTHTTRDIVELMYGLGTSDPDFGISYLSNLSAKEKLGIGWGVSQQAAGAGNAPNRTENVGKWGNTTNPLDVINIKNIGSGDFAVGSELVVLGWDPSDTHTDNFWEELASVDQTTSLSELSSGTFTAKKYLWVQFYTEPTLTSVPRLRFNNDTGSNYARRFSTDGGADVTSSSQTSLTLVSNASIDPNFSNMFIINNQTEEKLVINHTIGQLTAGAANVPRRTEYVGKWDNTANQITEIDITPSSGNIKGNLRVWGSN